MLKSNILLAAATVASLTAIPAMGQELEPKLNYFPQTGAELLPLLKECEDDSCMSFVQGVMDGALVYSAIVKNPSPFCATGDVDEAEIRDAIVNTIETTPVLAESNPALSVIVAFGRYWPCMSAEDIADIQSNNLIALDPDDVTNLIESDNHALIMGDLSAPYEKTIMVFHDPNCNHCRRFRSETDKLSKAGWKIVIYPVATTSEESAGYGAVEIALRNIDPAVVETLHATDAESLADITLAMKIAQEQGVDTKELLTQIAKSGAYQSVEANTEAFFTFGAKGTPAFIIGHSLYSGFMTAAAIEDLGTEISNAEAEADEAASAVDALPAEKEQ